MQRPTHAQLYKNSQRHRNSHIQWRTLTNNEKHEHAFRHTKSRTLLYTDIHIDTHSYAASNAHIHTHNDTYTLIETDNDTDTQWHIHTQSHRNTVTQIRKKHTHNVTNTCTHKDRNRNAHEHTHKHIYTNAERMTGKPKPRLIMFFERMSITNLKI